MGVARTIWGNDLRNIVRDRTVGVLLAVPLMFLALLRFGFPEIESRLPGADEYRSLALAVFCLLVGAFPAFMTSFVMLDERDEGVFSALRVLPVSIHRILALRLAVVAGLSLIFPALLLAGSGLHQGGWERAVVLPLLCALSSPAATLLAVSLAGNKIEGLTLFKGFFFVLGLAAVAVAQPGWWSWPAGVIPTYWVYAAYDAHTAAGFGAATLVAVAYHVAVLALAWRRFGRRGL